MLALFTVLLLLSVYVPIVSIIGGLFLLLPFFIYSSKYPVGPSLMLLFSAGIVSLIAGGLPVVPVAIMYGTTGVVMGSFVRKQLDGWIVYMAGSLTFLINIIAQYVGTVALFDFSFIEQFGAMFKQSIEDTSAVLGSEPVYTEKQIDNMIQYVATLLPAILVIVSFLSVLLLMAVNYPIAKRLGVKIKKLQPFYTVRFPRAILWYYLFFMAGALIVQPESGTAWYEIYTNVMFILQACLYVQGLSFIFFFAHIKKWPKAISIMIAVLSFLMIPLLYLIRLLGIIDLGFDLRQRMWKKP